LPTVTDKKSVRAESVRATVRNWIMARVTKEGEVELPDLAKSAIAHFGRDSHFKQQLFEESLYQLVYDLGQKALQTSRRVDPDIVPEREDGKIVRSIFAKWMEHAGDHHVAVLQMSKEDLKLAEAERRERGAHETAIANLWRYLREHMKGSDEIVADRFTSAQIETLYRRFVSGEEK
jgi:hypothetical protein